MNFRGYDSWKQDDPADSELGTCREAAPVTRCAQCGDEIAAGRRWCRGCADHEVSDGISAETANRRLAAIIDD